VAIKHLGVTTVRENNIRFRIRRFVAFQLNKIYKLGQIKNNYFYSNFRIYVLTMHGPMNVNLFLLDIYVLHLRLGHKACTLK